MGLDRAGGVIARTARGVRAPHAVTAPGNGGNAHPADGEPAREETVEIAAATSPLIAQYLALKEQYPEALVLSRVGDFYEAYGEDAKELAAALNIVCTSKEAGKGKRVAMAGVPHHSVDHYLAKLLRQRRVVAIAEQMEEPVPNRLVRREIVRVLTPGTVLEDQFLDAARNNFLCAVASAAGVTAIASADVSTSSTELCIAAEEETLACELGRLDPAELVAQSDEECERLKPLVSEHCRLTLCDPSDAVLPEPPVLARVALAERGAAREALALLERYLRHVRLDGASAIASAAVHEARRAMVLDRSARRHLDLLAGSGESKAACMLGVICKTKSPMGTRLLTQWLCAPLLDIGAIRDRHDRVEAFFVSGSLRAELAHIIAAIGDVERIAQKVHARRAGPRDLAGLRRSLANVGAVAALLEGQQDERIAGFAAALADNAAPRAVHGALTAALLDEPNATLLEGGVIRPEYDADLAALFALRTGGREQLLALESAVRAETGIKSLKIKYTQAFGYYYEATRSAAGAMPAHFTRRQSLVNAERFTDDRLRELEGRLVSSRAQQVALERRLFDDLAARVDGYREGLLACARTIAHIDAFCSLAQVAAERGYARPVMTGESAFAVEAGRHPVVEAFGGLDFVPNECTVDAQRRFLLITGPNMGGKSTYLRQTALISILAQIGSFVPASRAKLGVVDRLFTRIGAGDDLAAGRSTFYVEMAEMATILKNSTPRSLLLIDEVGRGTGTIDGLAIAAAIGEYILNLSEAMPIVLFATHFHELVDLARSYPAVANLHVAVADEAAGPIFSHRLLPGSSSRSYGIAVAHMAGMPAAVVDRAKEIAGELERRPAVAARRSKAPAKLAPERDQLEMEIT